MSPHSSTKPGWEIVIGLEVHAQVTAASKLFSSAAAAFGSEPNESVSLVDAAMPGQLPFLNRACIEQAIRTGLALEATINTYSVFERKNYFYPDLPQGYQISQYLRPIVSDGRVTIRTDKGEEKHIGIERLHLEQDAGKSLHDQIAGKSCIDLNRSGVALMEIVTHPDLRSAEEAALFLTKLRALLRAVGSCDGNMQEGSLRADANVSTRRYGEPLGTRCEIKNLNSMRFLRRAIQFEASRQIDLLESGESIAQETRLFDVESGETKAMRSKAEAHDYRYFPDPDLPPLLISPALIERLRTELPELPDARAQRLEREYALKAEEAHLLAQERTRADYFEEVARNRPVALATSWVLVELFGRLNKRNLSVSESPVSASALGELLDCIEANEVSARAAKSVLDAMMDSPTDSARTIIARLGLAQLSDDSALAALVKEVVEENPSQRDSYRSGNEKVWGWFVGQVMKRSAGRASPQKVNELLAPLLKGSENEN